MPQSSGLGRPTIQRQTPMSTPKEAFNPSWNRKNRDSRRAASFMARMVRWRSWRPTSRTRRSRRSSPDIRMKIVKTRTTPPVATGPSSGAAKVRAIVKLGEGPRSKGAADAASPALAAALPPCGVATTDRTRRGNSPSPRPRACHFSITVDS